MPAGMSAYADFEDKIRIRTVLSANGGDFGPEGQEAYRAWCNTITLITGRRCVVGETIGHVYTCWDDITAEDVAAILAAYKLLFAPYLEE